jgi:hypothetical protein
MLASIKDFQETITSTEKVLESDQHRRTLRALFWGNSMSLNKTESKSPCSNRDTYQRDGSKFWKLNRNFFFHLAVLGFELKALCLLGILSTTWGTLPNLFCVWYFQDKISWITCPAWLQTAVLLISASWVVRITGMSHQHPAINRNSWAEKYNQWN